MTNDDDDDDWFFCIAYALFAAVPCCNNKDPNNGYCGQVDGNGIAMYSLCDNPEDFFFWDYVHPTHSAWEDIMERLEGRIEDFLGIKSSWE